MAAVVFFVVRVGHRIEEHLEAGQAADILGRTAPFPVDEARGYLTSGSPGLTVSTVMVRRQSSPISARGCPRTPLTYERSYDQSQTPKPSCTARALVKNDEHPRYS